MGCILYVNAELFPEFFPVAGSLTDGRAVSSM